MPARVARLLHANRATLIDQLTARIIANVPRYARVDAPEMRANIASLFDELVRAVELGSEAQLTERLVQLSRQRLEQGFSLADYLRALLQVAPAMREVLRGAGPASDPAVAADFAKLEARMNELVATVAGFYVEATSSQLVAKNAELNRLNQQLRQHERRLTREAEETRAELGTAVEFNQRVIESLSSGLLVVESQTRRVTLYSERMQELLGIPAEEVLGRNVGEVFRGVQGLDPEQLIGQVMALGRLPTTRLRLVMPNGRRRAVLVRANRMLDEAGRPEATVVVVDDVTERELLVESFSRYVSRELVQRLLARAEPMGLGGERRICTLMFADIRGFTGLAEHATPEELQRLLNDYFELVIGTIVAHDGFIDKFVGDKVMAIFSRAEGHADAAGAAVQAAAQIQAKLAAIAAQRQSAGLPALGVGIGLNTGEVLIGNIGSAERMDFTAIGDPVNVADRLQDLARAGEVLLGETTAQLVSGRVALEDRGAQPIKGRQAPVGVFALKG